MSRVLRLNMTVSQGYYDDEGDSEMSGAHADEEVAMTKRGRAVKLPAKYKAEASKPISVHYVFAFCDCSFGLICLRSPAFHIGAETSTPGLAAPHIPAKLSWAH